MAEPWTFAGEAPAVGATAGTVTLVQGSTFCISGRSGDVIAGMPQGLFFRDSRFLSGLELRVNGHHLEPLSAFTSNPFTAMFVSRAYPRAGVADSTLVAFRTRYVGRGMREDVKLCNYGLEPARCIVELLTDADFADLFEVKESRVEIRGQRSVEVLGNELRLGCQFGERHRGVVYRMTGFDTVGQHGALVELSIEPGGEWRACLEVAPVIEDEEIEPRYRCGRPVETAAPTERHAQWRRQVPTVTTNHTGLALAVTQSHEDLGALRIFDPDYPERTVVAAGAPWFMTLFGRDSLLTSWMALIVDPDLALGVLQTLARFQGDDVVAETEEEPGRILHEMRFGSATSLSLGGGHIYYGTADATPLFVMLLGELQRWGIASDAVVELMPHADRAMSWIAEFGDRDGDGFVEYARATPRGLRNQGWKDSWDGIRFADGRLGEGPIALCEVQAYTYGAYIARAHFAHEAGDHEAVEHYRGRAAALKEAFNRDFWIEDKGWFALGLDGDKRPLDALTSNIGHCLWTGIVDEDKAPQVAAKLVSTQMFTGWGVRTLGSSMVGYNPISYHNGSIWPHDTAIVAAGLMRYGFVEEAHRVIMGLLDTAAFTGGRLPELFGGLDRSELPVPLNYPASCSPQAWAAASPLLLLRSMLRLDPWLPHGKVWLDPVLPAPVKHLRVERIPLAGTRVSIEVERDTVSVEGMPAGVELIHEPRHPTTALRARPERG